MTIRTFRAPSVAEALTQVKKELGAAAVILHTRTYKVGGVLGVGAKTITEITATSEMHVAPRLAPRNATPKPATAAALPPRPVAVPAPDLRTPVAVPSVTVPPAPIPINPQPSRPEPHIHDPSVSAQLRDEMAMLRRLVGRMVHSNAAPAPSMPHALQSCYLKMIEAEVASEIADAVVAAVREELPHAQLSDSEATRAAVLRKLAAYIPASDTPPEPVRGRDGRPTTIALIGPTGVGKTTTIAKLAATYKLRMGKRVGLVTGDTYRIAAVEQLRTYAGIIGLPLRVALTPAEMRAGCEALNDCDVILVDTAGRAPSDSGKVSELGAFLDAALPHQVHLVLSSTASEACMRHAVASFAAVGPTHLIYTKLDEAVSFGVLVNIARKVNAKLSFVTTGQEVPDQIEAGDAHRLATLILEGGIAR